MAKRASTFRQRDVTVALKAVRAAGYNAARVVIDKAGKIEIATMSDNEAPTGRNEWDDVAAR